MWIKKGLLFQTDDFKNDYIRSHASIPFALHLHDDLFRIYFSSRNENGKSLPYFIDAEIADGIIKLKENVTGPIMNLGALGTFDDNGIMPSSLLKVDDKIYMYYIGWNPQVSVSYRLAIGLAISHDNGISFERYSEGPICDRSLEEPFFNTAPYVIREPNRWLMYYISCTGWQIIDDYPEPSYHIKMAQSQDGIHWKRDGIICLDYDKKAKALGRPCVIYKEGTYQMYFSYRNTNQYRISADSGYKIGFATSVDSVHWDKKYDETGIGLSVSGWDSKMMEYCHVFEHKGTQYMLYNGNDFGKEGFGYATR